MLRCGFHPNKGYDATSVCAIVYEARSMQLVACTAFVLNPPCWLKQEDVYEYLSAGIDLYIIRQSAVCGGNIQTSTAADSPYLLTHHLISEEDPGRCKALPDHTRRTHGAAARSQNEIGSWQETGTNQLVQQLIEHISSRCATAI